MPDVADGGGAAMLLEQRVEPRFVTDQQEAGAGVAHGGDLQALQHHERRVVATHGVDRQRVGRCQREETGHAASARQARTAPFSASPAGTTSRPS